MMDVQARAQLNLDGKISLFVNSSLIFFFRTCVGQQPSICYHCGDSILQSVETCDDGNTNANDGCSASCLVENGWWV